MEVGGGGGGTLGGGLKGLEGGAGCVLAKVEAELLRAGVLVTGTQSSF